MDKSREKKMEFIRTIEDLCSIGYSDRIHVLLPFRGESIMCFFRNSKLMVFVFKDTPGEYTDKARDIVIARVKKRFGPIDSIQKREIYPQDYDDSGKLFDELDDAL